MRAIQFWSNSVNLALSTKCYLNEIVTESNNLDPLPDFFHYLFSSFQKS